MPTTKFVLKYFGLVLFVVGVVHELAFVAAGGHLHYGLFVAASVTLSMLVLLLAATTDLLRGD